MLRTFLAIAVLSLTAYALEEQPTFKVDAEMVVVRASVTDNMNRYVTGLGKENFHLFEDKVEQQIVHFSQEDAPVSVGFVLDVSDSMKPHIEGAKQAIVTFLSNGRPQDEYFLITFNHLVNVSLDWTQSANDLLGVAALKQPSGSTAIYDAVYLGLLKVREGRNDKKVLIVITDGEDNSSHHSYGELREVARETDALIYVIGKRGNLPYGQYIIEALSDLSGGRAFFPDNLNELEYYCQLIHEELRSQYVLGYYPMNLKRDGKWRKIKVKITPPEGLPKLRVRAREGYYAPREEP